MKKIISFLLVLCLFVSISWFVPNVNATSAGTRASDYISMYYAQLEQGGSGQAILNYYINSGRLDITKIGALKVLVFTSYGEYVTTIYGSTGNGLMAENTYNHGGTYTINLTSGRTYYATVYFYSGNDTGSDTRNCTTNEITVPN